MPVLTSSKKNLEETRNYYRNLYSQREIEENVDIKAMKEIRHTHFVIDLDGFTYECYSFSFQILLRSLNHSYECGQLSVTQG